MCFPAILIDSCIFFPSILYLHMSAFCLKIELPDPLQVDSWTQPSKSQTIHIHQAYPQTLLCSLLTILNLPWQSVPDLVHQMGI